MIEWAASVCVVASSEIDADPFFYIVKLTGIREFRELKTRSEF